MPSDSGAAWPSPATNSERRLSNSSDGSAGSGYSKATTDSADFLATRPHTAAVLPGKPAGNPLQFVRVGPADLGSRAREQLRRAELAKRTEPSRIERQEDWQSNLDNWKSSRRKRVEHIMERCVEVRRMEHETGQPRTKSKTFNEMLEERAGRRRRNPLALYTEDDGHDLSDLGIGTSSTKSSLSEDCDTHSLASDGIDLDKNHSDVDNLSNCDTNRKLGSSANEYDTCTTTTISSPEPEEYTYEGAIEGYKSRIISQTSSNIVKTVVNNNFKEKSPDKINGDLNKIRTTVSSKIEEKVSSFQNDRANDTKNNNQRKDLPKVDIHKRREQFERENSQESQTNKPKKPEIANKLSIKERLSSLEKFTKETQIQKSTSDLIKFRTEINASKERLSSLDKIKSGSTETEKGKRLSNGDLSNTKSLKESFSSLKSQTSEEGIKVTKTEVKEVSMSWNRPPYLDAERHKEIPKISVEEEIAKCEKNDSNLNESKENDGSLKTSLSGIESQMQNFCRSLDSLDINGQTSPNSFERVQSLEDFDCAELQNNTISSDIETEDSGIHTARDSAPADDIADLTQVASPIGEPMVEISEYESSNEDGVTSIDPTRTEESVALMSKVQDIIIEEVEEQNSKTENTDSGSNYLQAVSQPEELTVTEDITEIQMDKEDEDTLKSLDNQDSSVSLNEPVSTASESDTVVFEGKMTIHVNLNEIYNNINAGAGNTSNSININSTNISTNCKSMPMVTVSNITTTTNISPKYSIKTLKTSSNNHTLLTNKLADVTCTVNCSLKGPVVENRHLCNSVSSSNNNLTNKSVVNQVTNINTEIAANEVNPPVSSSQDTNPFWQNRHRHRVEPNRRNTILFINNKPKTVDKPNSDAKDLEVIDALELAFKELDIEDTIVNNSATEGTNIKMNETDIKEVKEEPIELEPKNIVAPLYENVFYHNSADDAAAFALDLPTNVLEPPKEKPPPPPIDDNPQEDELLGNGNFKHTSSARRIKKEIRNKRTSFLGIEGQVDDSYLDADLTLVPRPDITSFLQEETKIERLLYKKTLSHDMDIKLRESRDSGVDVDRGPSAEAWYRGQSSPETSNPHSRQNSEPFTHVTVTSDEEEAAKKQKEQSFNTNLNTKLSHLSEATSELDETKIETLDKKLQQQQANRTNEDWPDGHFDDAHTKEVLRFERELLQLEQEELRRQRENLLRDQTRIMQKSVQDVSTVQGTPEKPPLHSRPTKSPNYRHSMPNLLLNESYTPVTPTIPERPPFDENMKRKPFVSEEHIQRHFGVEESRKVLYEERSKVPEVRRQVPNVIRPPQPILPPKPRSRESIEREITMRSSRVPSAVEYVNVDRTTVQLRQKPVQTAAGINASNGQYHPMTRHTLQALSAAPTPKLIFNADWMQSRNRKPANYNYNQHWLIQEAEQRRIEEQRNKLRTNQRHSYHQDMAATPLHNMQPLSTSQQHLPQEMKRTIRPEVSVPTVRPELPREDKLLSVSGRRKCSHCGEELGRGAAMIIESLSLCYHVWCFTCAVCGTRLGDGRAGADVRVRGNRLHCHQCYSGDDGRKYSCV